MHFVALVQQLRLMVAAGCLGGAVKIIVHIIFVSRVCTLIDDNLGAVNGCQTTKVSQTLLGNQNINIVLGVVDVGNLGVQRL